MTVQEFLHRNAFRSIPVHSFPHRQACEGILAQEFGRVQNSIRSSIRHKESSAHDLKQNLKQDLNGRQHRQI